MESLTIHEFSDSLADAVERAIPSVVQVQGRRRPASGLVFRREFVVTTARALGRDDEVKVRATDGALIAAEVCGWDPATGLVVLRASGLDAPPAAPRVQPVRIGHLVVAIGRSWSNAPTATAGIVSVIGGPLPTGPKRSIDRVIRTTAPMHSGFAGGALVDVRGDLVGVATAASIRGLQVVIPVDITWRVAETLVEHGTLKRGYLGVACQPVRLPERQRTDEAEGALLVVEVAPDSPAEAGGMLVGDIVTAFDGEAVRSPVDLLALLQGHRVGRSVPVRILRGGEARDLTLTIGERSTRRPDEEPRAD